MREKILTVDENDSESRRWDAACINYDLRPQAVRINNDLLEIALVLLLQ